MELSTFHITLALFGVVLVGAVPPLYRRWSDRALHRLVSLAAGIFIGTLFLHLLPELSGSGGDGPPAASDAERAPGLLPWGALLGGFLLLFVVERVWLEGRARRRTDDSHAVLLSATFVGLFLHSLTTGMSIPAFQGLVGRDWTFLAGILVHKGAEAFSLASVMSLAGLSRRRSLVLLGLFALATPLGTWGGQLVSGTQSTVEPLLAGFACGTFLYVAICDLLPEVFHETTEGWNQLAWVLGGIALSSVALPQLEAASSFVLAVGRESTAVFVAMAPYLLLGFLVAGVLSRVLRPRMLTRHFSREGSASVVKASLIGAPLPLCSCSVVPVAASLRRAGASKGATSAFLIATPETGVDSVSTTWALFDPLMTVLRPLAAILSAIATGAAVSWFVRGGGDRESAGPATGASPPATSGVLDSCSAEGERAPSSRGFVAGSLRYAFVDLLDDLAWLLLLGVLASGVIATVVPDDFFERSFAQGFSGLVLMLLVGIPIYVCAAASTPIAATMMLKGLSPGAALIFLLASPATNLASLVAISRTLGRRVLVVHLVTLGAVTLAIGWLVDALFPALGLVPSAIPEGEHSTVPRWIANGSAAVLAAAIAASILKTRFDVRFGSGRRTPRPSTPVP